MYHGEFRINVVESRCLIFLKDPQVFKIHLKILKYTEPQKRYSFLNILKTYLKLLRATDSRYWKRGKCY